MGTTLPDAHQSGDMAGVALGVSTSRGSALRAQPGCPTHIDSVHQLVP